MLLPVRQHAQPVRPVHTPAQVLLSAPLARQVNTPVPVLLRAQPARPAHTTPARVTQVAPPARPAITARAAPHVRNARPVHTEHRPAVKLPQIAPLARQVNTAPVAQTTPTARPVHTDHQQVVKRPVTARLALPVNTLLRAQLHAQLAQLVHITQARATQVALLARQVNTAPAVQTPPTVRPAHTGHRQAARRPVTAQPAVQTPILRLAQLHVRLAVRANGLMRALLHARLAPQHIRLLHFGMFKAQRLQAAMCVRVAQTQCLAAAQPTINISFKPPVAPQTNRRAAKRGILFRLPTAKHITTTSPTLTGLIAKQMRRVLAKTTLR